MVLLITSSNLFEIGDNTFCIYMFNLLLRVPQTPVINRCDIGHLWSLINMYTLLGA